MSKVIVTSKGAPGRRGPAGPAGLGNPLTVDVDAAGHKISGLPTPGTSSEAATKGYTDTAVSAAIATAETYADGAAATAQSAAITSANAHTDASTGTTSADFATGVSTSAPNKLGGESVTTSDGTTWVTILNVPITADQTVDITGTFLAKNTGATGGTKGDTWRWDQRETWKRVGGAAPVRVGAASSPDNADGDAGENAAATLFVANADNVSVDVQVRGVTGHTLKNTFSNNRQFC